MASIPFIRQAPAEDALQWRMAAMCERIVSMGLMAAAAPVLAASALGVAISSRRTPFIAHKRVGWRGQTLWMLKLRTMWGGEEGPASSQTARASRWVEYIDDDGGSEQKHADDPRVPNRFARFCRRHSIDEIPQLWHVIRGEMSLVGPRPVTADELRRHYGADAEEMLQVRPGIAGLWQISGRNRLSYAERKRLDLEFVRGRSLSIYAAVLLRTVPEVLFGGNSW